MPTTPPRRDGLFTKDGVSFLPAFIMITICFALWGFANDVTNPLVASFGKIFQISKFQSSFVQVAFYLGYFCMAFPAAIYIQRHSFKRGVMLGLTLYAVGALCFLPARWSGSFYAFLPAYFVMTCGLSFLETSCNPYVFCMGSEATGTRRLNFAQAFNPIGAITGAFITLTYVSTSLHPATNDERARLLTANPAQFEAIKSHDLDILVQPYLYIGIVVLILLVAIWRTRMPLAADTGERIRVRTAIRELWAMPNYRHGVIAQFFYVGAQTVCWAYIIYYGLHVFHDLDGLPEAKAHTVTTYYYLGALALFAVGRFVCTALMKYVSPSRMLTLLALAAVVLLLGVIFIDGHVGLYCLVGVSACMSVQFPTIYGIALQGVERNVKFAGAGLVMSILGGSIIPPLQAAIMDINGEVMGLSTFHLSFIVPVACFLIIAHYGLRVAATKQ